MAKWSIVTRFRLGSELIGSRVGLAKWLFSSNLAAPDKITKFLEFCKNHPSSSSRWVISTLSRINSSLKNAVFNWHSSGRTGELQKELKIIIPFLTKITIICQNLYFFSKSSMLDQYFDFWSIYIWISVIKFLFFNFWTKFLLENIYLLKFLDKYFDFWLKFRFLTKISIFD